MAITKKEIALVHVAKNKLGLEEDVYRLILEQEAGVSSSKDLNKLGLDKVMKRFRSLGFRRKPKRKKAKPKPGALPSAEQLKMIDHLYEDLGWFNKKRQIGFNKKLVGKAWPQSREEANKIIEAVKSMIARGYDK